MLYDEFVDELTKAGVETWLQTMGAQGDRVSGSLPDILMEKRGKKLYIKKPVVRVLAQSAVAYLKSHPRLPESQLSPEQMIFWSLLQWLEREKTSRERY
jgi:hypothetical protein